MKHLRRPALAMALALTFGGAATSLADSGKGSSLVSRSSTKVSTEGSDKRMAEIQSRFYQPWLQKYSNFSQTVGSGISSMKPDNVASQLYLLEARLVNIMKQTAADPHLTQQSKDAFLSQTRANLTQLQWLYQPLQEEMRKRAEKANPGQSGTTLVTRKKIGNTHVDTYAPSFKQNKPVADAVRQKLVAELTDKHKAKHPTTPIFEHLNEKTVRQVKSGELLEFVKIADKKGSQDRLRITRNAKHVVTSSGKDTMTAGSVKIIWDPMHPQVPEKALAVFVSNWSGTFQPNIASVEHTMMQRLTSLGFARDKMMLTPSMPLEPKIYEVLLSFRRAGKDKIADSVKRLVHRAQRDRAQMKKSWRSLPKASTTSPRVLQPSAKIAGTLRTKRASSPRSKSLASRKVSSKKKSPRKSRR